MSWKADTEDGKRRLKATTYSYACVIMGWLSFFVVSELLEIGKYILLITGIISLIIIVILLSK